MIKHIPTICLVLLLFGTHGLWSQSGLTTVFFETTLDDSQTVNAAISSALDANGTTHIAYVEDQGTAAVLNYRTYDNSNFSSVVQVDSRAGGTIVGPQMVIDQSGGIHIVYIIKRDNNSGTAQGNYAVIYATSTGGGAFTVSQVSTNSTDPSANSEDLYHCYVNGRPTITIDASGNVVIYYHSDSNSLNGYNSELVRATGGPGSWSREILFRIEGGEGLLTGTFSVTDDFSAPKSMGSTNILGTIDISDYRPQFFVENSGWSATVLQEFAGVFDNDDLHFATDGDGKTYMMWFNEATDPEKFYWTEVSTSGYTTPVGVPVADTPAGNLFGYEVDPVTGNKYFFYAKSFSDDGFLISFDENGDPVETRLTDVREVHGKRCLNVRDGFLSLVTGADNTKVVVTTGRVTAGTNDLNTDFSASATEALAGSDIGFTDLSVGNPTSWTWTFEGGTPETSTSQNPTVTYEAAGTYDVTLVISDGFNSDTLVRADYITIGDENSELRAIFGASATTIEVGESVDFTDQSFGGPTTWSWTFAGGSPATSSDQNATVTYNEAGSYSVSLTVGDGTSTDVIEVANMITVSGPGNLEADSLALVSLYNATAGSSWTTNTNWLTGNVEDWHGVTVTDGRVTALVLGDDDGSAPFTGNNLVGTLPEDLGDLTGLTRLVLGGNQLTGAIPESIGSLTDLTLLMLHENSLSDSIPEAIFALTKLDSLYLGGNALAGNLSSGIASLSALKVLTLNDNQLADWLPDELGDITTLKTLRLENNDFEGSVPMALVDLTLTTFNFSGTSVCEPNLTGYQSWKATVTNYTSTNTTCTNLRPDIDDQTLSVLEESPVGTVVGTVTASDPDGDAITYSIVAGNSQGGFSLNASTGQLTVANSSVIDYEKATSFELTISAADASLSKTATVTVALEDFIENRAPTFEDQTIVYEVDRGTGEGDIIGLIKAQDADGDAMSYTILSGNSNNIFSLDAPSGALILEKPESLPVVDTADYVLEVQVTDSYGSSTTATVTVTVTFFVLTDVTPAEEAGFTIYPNPATVDLHVKVPMELDKEAWYMEVYSIEGHRVWRKTADEFSYGELSIPVSGLESGTYLLILADETHLYQSRFIKR